MISQRVVGVTTATAHARTLATSRRHRLKVLDACLTQLEEAHDRNEVVVTEPLAARLRPHLGHIDPGTRIADVIDRGLRRQEHFLASAQPNADRLRPTVRKAQLAPSRVLVVDEHPVVVAGVRQLLASTHDFVVVGQASSAREALAVSESAEPDLILIDPGLPDMHAIEVCCRIRMSAPSTCIVVFVGKADDPQLDEYLAMNMAGVLVKDSPEDDLVRDLRRILSGETVVDPRVQRGSGAPRPYPHRVGLTPREADMLRLLSAGMTAKQTATHLALSPRTVHSYCASLRRKLHATSTLKVLAEARARGLV